MNAVNKNAITKINKFIIDFDPETTQGLPVEQSIIVIPYIVRTGVINSTESGYVAGIGDDPNALVDNYSFFSSILTGREAVYAEWENSTRVIDGGVDATTNAKYDPYYKKCFKVGNSKNGWLTSSQTKVQIGSSTANKDFVQEQIYRTYEVLFETEITDNDSFKLYKIPQIAGEQWLIIDTVDREQVLNKTVRWRVVFKSLNDTFNKSGLAVDQFIQIAKPGALSAQPLITNDKYGVPQVNIDLNYLDRAKVLPVTSAQLQFYGPAGMSNKALWVRPIYKSDTYTYNPTTKEYETKMRVGRYGFPVNYNASIPDEVSNNIIPEQNYFYAVSAQLAIDTYWPTWSTKFAQNFYDELTKKTYEGHIRFNKTNTEATNPLTKPTGTNPPPATYTNTLQDEASFSAGSLAPGQLPILISYNNAVTGRDTKGNILGNPNIDFTTQTDVKWVDFQIANFFYSSQFQQLPVSVRQTTPWALKDIPIIGGLLGAMENWVGGLRLGWKNVAINKYLPAGQFNMLMSAELCEWFSANYDIDPATNTDFILPFELFRANTSDELGGIIGANSTASVFNFNISDTFLNTTRGTSDIEFISSLAFGQQIDNTWYFYNSGMKIVNGNLENYRKNAGEVLIGYEVDMFHFQALAKSNFKITFYNGLATFQDNTTNSTPIYTGSYQTIAQYSNNTRNWTNDIKMGNDNFDPNSKNTLTWPIANADNIPDTNPTSVINFTFKGQKQAQDDAKNNAQTYPNAEVSTNRDIPALTPDTQPWTQFKVYYSVDNIEFSNTYNKSDLKDLPNLTFTENSTNVFNFDNDKQIMYKANDLNILVVDNTQTEYKCYTKAYINTDSSVAVNKGYYGYTIGAYTKNGDTSVMYFFLDTVKGSCNGGGFYTFPTEPGFNANFDVDPLVPVPPTSVLVYKYAHRPQPALRIEKVEFINTPPAKVK